MQTVEQRTMTYNRPYDLENLHGIFRAKIVKNGVKFYDVNDTKQALVDVYVYRLQTIIPGVPILQKKINKTDGEEWTPEPDDLVAVEFFDGLVNDPIITGYIPPSANGIQTPAAKQKRYYRKRSGTDLEIDKDGNETRNIAANRTTVIEGNDTTTINTGNISITVTQGQCTVQIQGKTAWTSNGTIELDGGSGSPTGVVTRTCKCSFTGQPHADVSTNVKASK